MMAQTKYKIGEFSRLGRVTVRTLRHYEKIGLLKPGIVDMWTGYRYYSPEQLQKLLSIVQLKQLGFSLAEISELYENDTHYPDIGALESKIKTCEEELQLLKSRHSQLKNLVAAQRKRIDMARSLRRRSVRRLRRFKVATLNHCRVQQDHSSQL